MTHERSIWARAMGGTLAAAALIASVSGGALAQSPETSAAPPMAAPSIPVPAAPFTIGYSNGGGVGNGFREEQVCTAKAEAQALGASIVNPLTNLIHRNTDAAGQLSDLRTLISQNVNAIVFNPNDPDALNPALAEAHAAGIPTVSVDAYVTDPNTWNLYNNQIKYAYLGAKWLFNQMGNTGTVWYTRGLAGHPADSDRDIGFNQALKEVTTRAAASSSRTPAARSPAGIPPPPPRSPTMRSRAARMTRSRASGPRAWAHRSSRRSRMPASRSCRSRMRTSAPSSASSSTRPTSPASSARP